MVIKRKRWKKNKQQKGINERVKEENSQKRTENGKIKIVKQDVQYCIIYTSTLHAVQYTSHYICYSTYAVTSNIPVAASTSSSRSSSRRTWDFDSTPIVKAFRKDKKKQSHKTTGEQLKIKMKVLYQIFVLNIPTKFLTVQWSRKMTSAQ